MSKQKLPLAYMLIAGLMFGNFMSHVVIFALYRSDWLPASFAVGYLAFGVLFAALAGRQWRRTAQGVSGVLVG
jgi:Na+/glutamate symporter